MRFTWGSFTADLFGILLRNSDGTDAAPLQGNSGSAHISASATSSGAVTTSDSTELTFKSLYVGTGGTVVIKHTAAGSAVSYVNVPDGSVLNVSGVRVMAATTASNIVWMNW